MIRYTPEEKLEIVHLVEHSQLSVKQTLAELQVPRSTFYVWYQRYQEEGPAGLFPRKLKRKLATYHFLRNRTEPDRDGLPKAKTTS
jgi:transposase-like protein